MTQKFRILILKLKATAVIGTISLLVSAATLRAMIFTEASAEQLLYAVLTVCLPAYYFTYIGFRHARPFIWKYMVFAWSFVFTYFGLAATLIIFTEMT